DPLLDVESRAAQSQRPKRGFTLEKGFRQRRAGVGSARFLPDQGDRAVPAQAPGAACHLYSGLARPDHEQPTAHSCASGTVTRTSCPSARTSWHESRELSARSVAAQSSISSSSSPSGGKSPEARKTWQVAHDSAPPHWPTMPLTPLRTAVCMTESPATASTTTSEPSGWV